MANRLNDFEEPNRCFWNYTGKRCTHKTQWVVKSEQNEFGSCHEHLERICRWMANEAPLKVEPVFSNWAGMEHLCPGNAPGVYVGDTGWPADDPYSRRED